MKSLRVALSSILIILIIALPVAADIDTMLNNVVSGVYVQNPGVYQSPSTTTLSAGSFSFRLSNDLLGKPALSFTAPKANLSCSGMDFDAGMLSILNLDQFESMLSQAGASLAWGVMIGIVYSLPGVGEAFQKLNEWARMAQSLFQQPCSVGKALGGKIGTSIFAQQESEKPEQKAGDGILSNLQQGVKELYNLIKMEDLYKTLPYSALNNAGLTDGTLQDLIASFFGILDIYLVDNDNNRIEYRAGDDISSKCGGKACGPQNIRAVVKMRKVESVEEILYGGNLNLYNCSTLNGNTCESIGEYTATTEGLQAKITTKLKTVVDSYYSKGTVTFGSEVKAMAVMLPNLSEMLKYAIMMKKYRSDDDATKIINALAEYISLLLLYNVLDTVEGYTGTAIGSNTMNMTQTELQMYQRQMESAKRSLAERVDLAGKRYQLIKQSYDMYQAIKADADTQVIQKFGKGAAMFR